MKLRADYLPEKYYLDKYSLPLESKIVKIVKDKLELEHLTVIEAIEEAVFETINYLKPKAEK